jgi:hypothetical protein
MGEGGLQSLGCADGDHDIDVGGSGCGGHHPGAQGLALEVAVLAAHAYGLQGQDKLHEASSTRVGIRIGLS